MTEIFYLIYKSLASFKHTVIVSVFGISYTCHHRPSCSQYTLGQINKNGTISGLWKGFRRLITCW